MGNDASTRPPTTPYHDMSEEEVAAALTAEEGREVTVREIRRIEAKAMRKLRQVMRLRGLTFDSLSMG
jgi:DNA-directed RNA polymerase sigma subunit (sigma70/sigma32)